MYNNVDNSQNFVRVINQIINVKRVFYRYFLQADIVGIMSTYNNNYYLINQVHKIKTFCFGFSGEICCKLDLYDLGFIYLIVTCYSKDFFVA